MGRDKKNERKGGKFVRLPHSMMKSHAWRNLSDAARSVHLVLIMRYNGSNNGSIYISSREAGRALSMNRKTVLRAFKELEEAGFIVQTRAAQLGVEGRGRSFEWRLTHLPFNKRAPTNDYQKK